MIREKIFRCQREKIRVLYERIVQNLKKNVSENVVGSLFKKY